MFYAINKGIQKLIKSVGLHEKFAGKITGNIHNSAAYEQYKSGLEHYFKVMPSWTFPILPLIIAAAFQVFAWFGGTMLSNLTAAPRVLALWGFALGEYSFMSPAMNAAKEVLGMSESLLVVLYQVVTLVVFTIINTTIFNNPFEMKYIVSYILLSAAVYVAYMW